MFLEGDAVNIAQQARKSADLTQEEFANIFGIPLPTLRKHEQLARVPSGATTTFYRLVIRFPKEMKRMSKQI